MKGFEKFKKKLRRGAFLRSLILGLSCGVLTAAGYMAVQKMATYTPVLWLSILLGCGVGLVACLLSYLVMRPSDKKIAQKLDHDLSLDEKVQTMLAYLGDGSAMLTLQREDTNRRLENTPTQAVKYRHPWKHIFAPLLASALMVVAVMMPVRAVPTPPEPEEPIFEISTWQQAALEELIREVKESDMEETPKHTIVVELEALLDNLNVPDLKAKEMKQMVVSVIVSTNRAVRDANSADDINLYLSKSEYGFVSDVGMAVGIINGLQTQKVIQKEREALRVENLATPLATMREHMHDALADFDTETFDKTDPAYVVLTNFVSAIQALEGEIESHSRAWAQTSLDGIFETLSQDLVKALSQQNINKKMGDHVVATLMSIFELTDEDIPPEEKPQQGKEPTSGENPDAEEEDKQNQGGVGDQELLFGSDDTIFDPAQNQQVKYGDVLLEYHKTISEKTLDGHVSEEMQQFIDNYFATLFDGSKEKDEAKN